MCVHSSISAKKANVDYISSVRDVMMISLLLGALFICHAFTFPLHIRKANLEQSRELQRFLANLRDLVRYYLSYKIEK